VEEYPSETNKGRSAITLRLSGVSCMGSKIEMAPRHFLLAKGFAYGIKND
jgi:hypothetical protein